MRRLLILILLGTAFAADAQQVPPREIWPQATSAARDGDIDQATKKTSELLVTGREYGLRTYPLYAVSAAAMAGQAEKDGQREVAGWARRATTQLDARSPAVSFNMADRAAAQNNWGAAVPSVLRGYAQLMGRFRTRLLSRADLTIVAAAAIVLSSIVFAVILFIRYGRSMAHDFREWLARRTSGGTVSVVAFALLFLPIFLWLGPMWLIFYWFAIFFGYANARERTLIVILALLVAAMPIIVDAAASSAALVNSPVVMAAVSSAEGSYQPETLRRLQELSSLVPDNPTVQILLGNLHVFEGNERQAAEHYRRAIQINDSAGAHVNLGNLHFLQNDYAAAITEYQRAEKKDPTMAIAFYNDSVASGETYRFAEQGQKLEAAKKADREFIEALSQNPPAQKIAMYHPEVDEAWDVSAQIARGGTARALFGNYSFFDLQNAALNPITVGALSALLLALMIWARRRRTGFAGSCIKCGRTFCHRCKSARESATYCTQCIHIYLKRDGVAVASKRAKMEEVSDHQAGTIRRNRLFTTFLPGSAQMLEGRTLKGLLGLFLFLFFLSTALLIGRLAPALGPVADSAQLLGRLAAVAGAVTVWLFFSIPVYRRRAATA